MLVCLHFSSQVWNEEGGSPLFLMAACCWEDQNSFVLFGE